MTPEQKQIELDEKRCARIIERWRKQADERTEYIQKMHRAAIEKESDK